MSGVTWGQKVRFWVLFFIVIQLLLGFLSYNLETVTGNNRIDEDWRNTYGILMLALGARPEGCGPKGSKIHFVQT